jgi:diguanylate cyclase (GGDEF)-like protein/PAS domain S-box-containing protein
MFDVHKTTAAAYSIAVDDGCFRFASANQACLDLTGLTSHFLSGLSPHDLFAEEVADRIVKRYEACRASRQAVTYISEYQLLHGLRSWRTTLFPILDPDGTVTALFGVCVDITEETAAEREKEALRTTLSIAIGSIKGGFWVYDLATQNFETSRPLAEYIAGPGYKTLNLAEYAGYIHADDLAGGALLTPRAGAHTVDFRVITYDGRTRWLQTRRTSVQDSEGHLLRMVGLVVDITEQKTAMRALESEATTDSLTGLSNRRVFDRTATRLFKASAGSTHGIALLLLDLDGFKPINDRHGHRAGDEILRKVAKRLGRLVRSEDTLARLGGDEFAILLRNGSPKAIQTLTSRIERAFTKVFHLDDTTISLGVSVGIAVSGEGDDTFRCVLDRADRALYANKNQRHRLSA